MTGKCNVCGFDWDNKRKDVIGVSAHDVEAGDPIGFDICESCGASVIGKGDEWMSLEQFDFFMHRMDKERE